MSMTTNSAGEGKEDVAAPSARAGAQQCSRCDAGATVMQMVRSHALWMATIGRGDGEPPAALWEAVWAEDWPTVRSEWDKWVQPALRELHDTAREWRSTAAVMVDSAARTVGEPFPDVNTHDPVAVRRQWGQWIVEQFTAAREGARSDEWSEFSQALPAELQPLAMEHPTRQAELATSVFEVEALHRNLSTDEGN